MAMTPIEEAEYRQLKAAKEAADRPPAPEAAPTLGDVLRFLVRTAHVANESTERLFLAAIDAANLDAPATDPATPASKS